MCLPQPTLQNESSHVRRTQTAHVWYDYYCYNNYYYSTTVYHTT